MSNVFATFVRHKHDDDPMVITVGNEKVYVSIDWYRTQNNQIHLNVRSVEAVDILIPSTFKTLKAELRRLEAEIERLKRESKN